ncbi:copper-binding protein [Sphingobium lactosutens]|uniref:plastocyanin/azurin family copper-binding protein n=1 Tax=Sphingobium lactosutens TaxID=522773 RepID=UPI0015BDC6FE|nr:plastocyanin/azurin family copper-binding protein [Sphingobium lactosutens]NWK94373.1 copper-binding protein [Sphingobium lactosutens]
MSRWKTVAALAVLALGLSAEAQAPIDWNTAQPLTLRLSSFKFEPSDVILQHGVPYDLHFENASSGSHDFAAKAFFGQARIKPEDQAKIRDDRIELGGGETVHVHLVAPSPGSFKVRCTHFMHSAFGMTGRIVVQ